MRALAALSLLLLASPSLAERADRDHRRAPPIVAVTAGPIYALAGEQADLASHVERASKMVAEAAERVRREEMAEPIEEARRRLERLRGYLGLAPVQAEAVVVPTGRRDDDRRAADAVLSGGVVLVSHGALGRELQHADQALAQAQARAHHRMAELLGSARAEVAAARSALAALGLPGAPPVPAYPAPQPLPAPVAPPPVPAPVRSPMAEPSFQALMQAIESESFPREKLRVLETGSAGQLFLVGQLQQVLQRLSFASDQLKAARLLAPRIVDRENSFRLYESFTFAADKDQLSKILAEAGAR